MLGAAASCHRQHSLLLIRNVLLYGEDVRPILTLNLAKDCTVAPSIVHFRVTAGMSFGVCEGHAFRGVDSGVGELQ